MRILTTSAIITPKQPFIPNISPSFSMPGILIQAQKRQDMELFPSVFITAMSWTYTSL
jgi:hypothetical protein